MRSRLASETESGCEAATAENGWGDWLGLFVYQKVVYICSDLLV